jgi:predicted Zn-dependent protease
MVALLGHAYAAANRRSEAQAILQQLSALSKERYVPSYPIAAIYAALGQKDEAFASLQKAYDEHDSWMDYLGLDPRLDGLRSDPRFAALLRRMNLVP